MKYLAALLSGLLCGVVLFIVGLYYNPFVGRSTVSPLAISDTDVHSMSYSAVMADSILFTNDGESISKPYPEKVAELWEPTIVDTQLLVTTILDSRGQAAGIGIKMSSPSEKTRLLKSQLLVDSVWHLYIPGQGTLAISQTENYWSYFRDIIVPAWRNSSNSWRGTWTKNMTIGPGALGMAAVTGLSGDFSGEQGEAVESLNAQAYSILQGPVAMTGTLIVAMADPTGS